MHLIKMFVNNVYIFYFLETLLCVAGKEILRDTTTVGCACDIDNVGCCDQCCGEPRSPFCEQRRRHGGKMAGRGRGDRDTAFGNVHPPLIPLPFISYSLYCVGHACARNGAAVIACVGGGSNAIGLFHPFVGDESVKILGIEAGGVGNGLGEHAATIVHGKPGVLHGCYTLLLQDAHGQVQETQSVSAGLDYSAVGPEHAFLHSVGRAQYQAATDADALSALDALCAQEGILPAIESSHALAGAKAYGELHPGARVLVGLSGRGDKDMATLLARSGGE